MYRAATVILVMALATLTLAKFAWELPIDYELSLSSPLDTSFTCEGRSYGYYADVDNNCEIFHVCLPVADASGTVVITLQYTFTCGNQTILSQDTATCKFREDAFPCDQAPTLYDVVNEEFGRIPEPLE
ncbi:U-scoloptoxin(01)-Cw1a-like [Homarus americanus]|uniref:U-scoloptoxin(01)-Cw1a-like 15 n=2 Tax=Homarus americanus TaxID=6706 RepID=A0A8J5JI19_HOMAM|nr:U-scoloptoxin(01)-Cw1a-like [Homarus americanus]XP_042207372.1 U-scoloptoxin(01)-Cw1a-like [Homarus americanus]KAG7156551.1 U-scoloptoxin(01)-Cw1a-like 15 [Homarus americanus]